MARGYLSVLFPRKRPEPAVAIAPPPPPAKTREELVAACREARDTLSWAHQTTPGCTYWAERLQQDAEDALDAYDRAAGRAA